MRESHGRQGVPQQVGTRGDEVPSDGDGLVGIVLKPTERGREKIFGVQVAGDKN